MSPQLAQSLPGGFHVPVQTMRHLYCCQGEETEKRVGSASGLLLLFFFIIFLASGSRWGCFSSTRWCWSAPVRQLLGESGIDSSGHRTKRSLRRSWARASRIYWGRLAPPSKICSYWRQDKATRRTYPQGLQGRERAVRGAAIDGGEGEKKCLGLLNQCEGKGRSWLSMGCAVEWHGKAPRLGV